MKTSTLPAGPVGDRSTDWLDHAACRRSDPELFFPVTDIRAPRAHVEAAKKVCRHCPVKRTCLSWAMDNGPEAGIWGAICATCAAASQAIGGAVRMAKQSSRRSKACRKP